MDDQSHRTASAGVMALRTTGIALLLAATLGACNKDAPAPPANQAEAKAAAAAEATAPSPAAHASDSSPAASSDAAIVIPDDVDAIWADIDKHQAELATVVATGNLGEAHHHAFAIRDLVAAEPPGRVVVVVTGDQAIVGTTDTFTAEKPDQVRASEADLEYLLASANSYFPPRSMPAVSFDMPAIGSESRCRSRGWIHAVAS